VTSVVASLRAARRRLTFSVVVSVLVGVGAGLSGANLAAVQWFSSPWPFETAPESLVVVNGRHDLAGLTALRDQTPSLDLAAYRKSRHTVQLGAVKRAILVECASPNYLRLMVPSWPVADLFAFLSTVAGETAVVSSRLASVSMNMRGSLSSVDLRIGRRTFAVIGVAPPTFTGADTVGVDAWIQFDAAPEVCTSHASLSGGGASVSLLGRLRPSETYERAAGQVRATGATVELLAEHRARQLARELRVARWGLAGALVLLLIGCVNACALCLMRTVGRRPEFVIRRQLGASTWQVVMGQLLELIPIVALTAAVALVSGMLGWRLLYASASPDTPQLSIAGYLAASITSASGAVLVAGIWPALWASRVPALTRAQFVPTQRSVVLPVGNAFLLAQSTAAFLLLAGGLTVWIGIAETRRQAGFDVDRVGVVTLNADRYGYVDPATLTAALDTLQRRIAEVSGVEATAVANSGLLGSLQDVRFTGISRRPHVGLGGPVPPSAAGPPRAVLAIQGSTAMALINLVSRDYFKALGTQVVEGRAFQDSDDARSEPVIVVDRSLVQTVWPDTTPVGQCAYVGASSRCARIVGVVETRRPLVVSQDAFEFFVPLAQGRLLDLDLSPTSLFVRFVGDPSRAGEGVSTVLQSTGGSLPASLQLVDDLARSQSRTLHTASQFFGVFTACGLAMTASGIYALAAFGVRYRRREIAVRSALGASWPRLLWTFGRQMLWVIAAALGLGSLFAMALVRVAGSIATGVEPLTAGVLGAAGSALCAALLFGAAVPFFRAVTVPPAECLREHSQ